MGVNPFNILTLLILLWTARISPTANHFLILQNLTNPEQEQIILILKELNTYKKLNLTFEKKELDQYVLGIAYVQYFECHIELNQSIFAYNKSYFKPVLYHEIGHCFGLEHSENKDDVMYFEARSINEYKLDDWKRFRKQLNACF